MKNLCIGLLIVVLGCKGQDHTIPRPALGAEQIESYLDLLKDRQVGLTVNHTSLVKGTHLVDTLLARGISIQAVYTPEHGFRGTADAGERVDDEQSDSGFEIISLYGSNKKPSAEQLSGIDVMVFDIQDVGVRFYTYISTMHYVMEACAENGIPFIVLDRPNPNGSYVDGPVLDTAFRSFVGMHPIPIVHGLTVGELAQMINGEGWLKDAAKVDLTIVPVLNWEHSQPYSLPVRPSPNLPNDRSIVLYPSLCLFEGTVCSVGRGTNAPFQQFGHPILPGEHSFTPKPGPGSKNPKLNGQLCFGKTFVESPISYQLDLKDLIQAYRHFANQEQKFFNSYFDTLAGTEELRMQIENGQMQDEIRASWEDQLTAYSALRSKYLLYP